MAGRFGSFERDIQVATAGLAPEAINAKLAAHARAVLAETILSGQGSPNYEVFVNGRRGAREEQVQAPGPIVYQFVWWRPIIGYALDQLQARSPLRSGEYRRSWTAMVDGRTFTDFGDLPGDAEVTIVNWQPYARKVDVGHMRMSVPHGLVEATRQAVQRRFGALVTVERRLVQIPGGYVLKGQFRRGVRPGARMGLRKDTEAGRPMTYPALVMRMKGAA